MATYLAFFIDKDQPSYEYDADLDLALRDFSGASQGAYCTERTDTASTTKQPAPEAGGAVAHTLFELGGHYSLWRTVSSRTRSAICSG